MHFWDVQDSVSDFFLASTTFTTHDRGDAIREHASPSLVSE